MTRDALGAVTTSGTFSFSLAVAQVALPLLGLAAGYSAAELGVFIAGSALAQMAVRSMLVIVMRHWTDRALIATAVLLLAVSGALVLVSVAPVPFAIAQILQGAARACFWTGSQTHAVRTQSDPVRAIASLNLASSLGMMAGPVAAGVLAEHDLAWAMWASALSAAASLAFVPLLQRLPTFAAQQQSPGRVWTRPGVNLACWASASTGAWRGMLSSYVPIVLERARQSPSTIGLLISLANVAVLVGSALLVRGPRAASWTGLSLAMLATGLGTAAMAFVADAPVLAAVALVVSGLGAGILQTLGPAMASTAVSADDQGRAIVATGTFRAAALFASPLGVAGLISLAGVTATGGLAAVGVLIAVPAVRVRRMMRS